MATKIGENTNITVDLKTIGDDNRFYHNNS